VTILGASADPQKALAAFKQKQKLNFDLVSDPGHEMIEKYGVWRPKKFMGRLFKGIVRSTFVIGSDGKIEAIWDPASAKGHAREVLEKVSA
jgi:peroxiredoxin Q/BCP